jgi:hypothetical protein
VYPPREAGTWGAAVAARRELCENRESMFTALLFLHSWLRWVVLAAGVAAVFSALGKDTRAVQGAERWGLIFMIALDTQLLLGLLLYGLFSPMTGQAMQDFGAAMGNPVLRFWAVEHLTLMMGAVVLAHVGRVLARKTTDIERRRKRLLVCFAIALLLVLAGIPWPGMPAARPLFRF